jgi:hypothetical protein
MEVGEEWAHATSDTSISVHRARILKIDGNRTSVEFLDSDDVPTHRKIVRRHFLKVRWDDAWDYFHRARVREADEYAEFEAVDFVFRVAVPWQIAYVSSTRTAQIKVEDADALSAICGLPLEEIEVPEVDQFKVARAIATIHAHEILYRLNEDEKYDLYDAMRKYEITEPHWMYISDDAERRERMVDISERMTRRRNSVIRTWAGEEAAQTVNMIERLRHDVVATRTVARKALDALAYNAKTKGAIKYVEDLERALPDLPATPKIRRNRTLAADNR